MSCIDLPDKMLKYLLYLLYLQLPHVNYENTLMSAYSESATKCSNDPDSTETEKYHDRLNCRRSASEKTVYYRKAKKEEEVLFSACVFCKDGAFKEQSSFTCAERICSNSLNSLNKTQCYWQS